MTASAPTNLTVAVLFGGRSVEHEVSIITGHQIMDALEVAGFNLLPIYIDKEGAWFAGAPLRDLKLYSRKSPLDLENLAGVQAVSLAADRSIRELLADPKKSKSSFFSKPPKLWADVFLPAIHGATGEDGAIQGLFELADVPYIGCGILASALALHKATTKRVLSSGGIPVLDYLTIARSQWAADQTGCLAAAEALNAYPLIVKPCSLGSSIGVSRASDRIDLADAISLALELDETALLERALTDFFEINCAVRGSDRGDAIPSACELPCTGEQVLTFEEKYKRGGGKNGKGGTKGPGGVKGSPSAGMASLQRLVPAPIPDELTAQVQRLASQAFKLIGGSGVARIDFLFDKSTSSLYLNEINTMPGSLAFYLWEASGLPFDELVTSLVAEAQARHRQRQGTRHRFDANLLSAT